MGFLRNRKMQIIALIILALIIVDIFVTGFAKFVYSTVRCGKLPVETVPRGFFLSATDMSGYILPGDNGYRLGAGNRYYCTQADAEREGIHVDPLTKEGLRQDVERQK